MLVPRSVAGCAVAFLVVIFVLRCYATYRIFNDTKDEAVHIASGLEIWHNGRYTTDRQHPPLARMAIGLAARLAGLPYANPGALWGTSSVDLYWRTLSAARMGNLIFVPLLFLYVYRWGRQLYGPAAGVAAAALASMSPNLLAHAALATVDFGSTTTSFIAAFYFWKWSREPGWRSCLKAALAFGVAAITKFSALVFLPAMGFLFFLLARWDKRPWLDGGRWRRGILRVALFGSGFLLVVWAGYLFDVEPLPPAVFFAPHGSLAERVVRAGETLAGHREIPAPAFVRGVLQVVAKNASGHPSYLLGHIGQFGWWYYFPLALAVKTTLPFLVLAVLGLVLWPIQKARRQDLPRLDPLLAAGLILLISMTSTLDLGIRYVLLVYPLVALAAAGLFLASRTSPLVLGLAAAMGIWHAAESVAAHPDYLAYFNPIARGREKEFLLDSNLDWGQDLERLRRYLDDHGIASVYLSYFGHTKLPQLGFSDARPLHPGPPPAGWVAISKNHIGGIDHHPSEFAWAKEVKPAARIGKSILLYRVGGGP